MEEILEIHKKLKQKIRATEDKAIQVGIEVYRKIDGYENYIISSLGNVKNIKTGRILKQLRNNDGYYVVTLYKSCKGKLFSIHRLVAIAFIANPENKNCVDHVDNNRLNNN